jgi:hypothetical protein
MAANRQEPSLPEVAGDVILPIPSLRGGLLPELVEPAKVGEPRSPLRDQRIIHAGGVDGLLEPARRLAVSAEPTTGDFAVGPGHRELRMGPDQQVDVVPHHGEIANVYGKDAAETLQRGHDPRASRVALNQ